MINALEAASTRPYLVRALYEWCTDNGFTPYIAVQVDDSVQVPREYVKNGEIVLNISFDATSALKLGNEFIEFKARFAGTAREIMVPMGRVLAIYARENGQGMAFPPCDPAAPADAALKAPRELGGAPQPAEAGDRGGMHLIVDERAEEDEAPLADEDEPPSPPPRAPGGGRPALRRVK